jgi:hypothetical protein
MGNCICPSSTYPSHVHLDRESYKATSYQEMLNEYCTMGPHLQRLSATREGRHLLFQTFNSIYVIYRQRNNGYGSFLFDTEIELLGHFRYLLCIFHHRIPKCILHALIYFFYRKRSRSYFTSSDIWSQTLTMIQLTFDVIGVKVDDFESWEKCMHTESRVICNERYHPWIGEKYHKYCKES